MGAPPIRRMTPKKQAYFLEALATLGNVRLAAKRIKMSPNAVYESRRADPEFAAAWEQALATAMDTMLEPEAMRRAVTGVLKPVYQGGALVGHVREYSDTLLIFLLKGGKPEKYRENIKIDTDMTVHLEVSLQEGMKRLEVLRHGARNRLTA